MIRQRCSRRRARMALNRKQRETLSRRRHSEAKLLDLETSTAHEVIAPGYVTGLRAGLTPEQVLRHQGRAAHKHCQVLAPTPLLGQPRWASAEWPPHVRGQRDQGGSWPAGPGGQLLALLANHHQLVIEAGHGPRSGNDREGGTRPLNGQSRSRS